MYYAKSLRGTSSDNKTREWRLCVRHEDEKRRILQSCHESQTGELLNYEAYLPFVHCGIMIIWTEHAQKLYTHDLLLITRRM